MRMKSGGLRLLLGAVSVCLWAACYPGEINSASQTDVVLTFHDSTANFTVNNTLALPDSIVDIGVAGGGNSTFDHQYDAQILARIQQEFQALGYTFVDPAVTTPDAVVLVSGVTIDNYQAWGGYPWWGWWGWYPYMGTAGYGTSSTWYYPWYPVVVTSYKSGTIFIQLVDPGVTPPTPGQAVSIWAAALNGMLEGTNTEILSRISNNITQAFDQSPYLSTQ